MNPRSKVSVLDLLRVRNHIVGTQPLPNALETYAADVSASNGVTVLDLVEMHKVILGLYANWQSKDDITFFIRTDAEPPPVGASLNSSIIFQLGPQGGITGDVVVDFWAVKTGDVVR